MATHTGNNGVVQTSAGSVAEVVNFTLNESAVTIDSTAMGDSYKTHKVGTKEWAGNISCWWEDSDADGQDLLTAGNSLALVLYPDGTASSATKYSGTATISAIARDPGNDAMVTANFDFTGNGALTKGTV
jgi:hypothetical protein